MARGSSAVARSASASEAAGSPADISAVPSHWCAVANEGLSAIAPAGIVMGIVTGTETTKLSVAAGDYNTQIDNRIAAIRSTCRTSRWWRPTRAGPNARARMPSA